MEPIAKRWTKESAAEAAIRDMERLLADWTALNGTCVLCGVESRWCECRLDSVRRSVALYRELAGREGS